MFQIWHRRRRRNDREAECGSYLLSTVSLLPISLVDSSR
jgi:hypothetical protein